MPWVVSPDSVTRPGADVSYSSTSQVFAVDLGSRPDPSIVSESTDATCVLRSVGSLITVERVFKSERPDVVLALVGITLMLRWCR